ncbi:phage portal protein [Sporolactobacillus terrae]|uniref:phage portal protein n=1 Tax=Sporolactobacillus terrae TaxID=269673 RepID=UPI001CBCF580|nr:phage portal protein [Sporolactobacillus terrae]UAK16118.1 phage portal protein [Sporolactobacillus terrae]
MANIFRWGKSSDDTEKDYFSTSIITPRPTTGKISEQEALKIPAVRASIDLISDSIAQLPVYLYSEDDNKSVSPISDRRTSLLNDDANDFSTAQALKKLIVKDYLLSGRSYIYVKNDQLHYLEAKNVQEEKWSNDGVTIAKKKFIYYGIKKVELNESEVLEIDSGMNGVLVDAEAILATASAIIDYQQSLMLTGASPIGVLKVSSRLTEQAINRLRANWVALYNGPKKAGRTVILEEGMDFLPLSMKPDELQLTQANSLIIAEIARIFNIPESMINSSANKYNSLEANSIQFLQHAVSPIITSFEAALNKNLLSSYEKQSGYYFRFDTSELLRTTEKEKIDATSSAFTKGLISFNEARYTLDKPPVDDDFYLLNLGSVIKNAETGELTIPNMGVQTQKKGEGDLNGKN